MIFVPELGARYGTSFKAVDQRCVAQAAQALIVKPVNTVELVRPAVSRATAMSR